MLLVKTVVKNSEIAGLDLFADQDLAEGEKIWAFTPGFDLHILVDRV